MGLYLRFGGAQIVAVEINSVCGWREGAERGAELFKDERLVGAVGDHRVGHANQEIARVAPVVDARQCRVIHPFVLQHRGDFIAARRVHQRAAAQIRDAPDVGPARHQNDGRGLLEDDREHDQVAAHHPFAQDAGAADAEVRFFAGNRFGGMDIGTTLADGDVEPGVAIVTLIQCSVVASKLELVLPFELQGHLIARNSRMRSQQEQASGHG